MRSRIGSIVSGVVVSTMALSLVGCNLKAGNLAAPSGDSREAQAGGSFAPGEPTPIAAHKELVVTDLSVVNDYRAKGMGPWSFGALMNGLSGGKNTEQFVLNWLNQWTKDVYVNGQKVQARKAIKDLIIDPWKQASGGSRLDMSKAPFRLLAITNRVDLRKVGNAGEGRLVFGVVDLRDQGENNPFRPLFTVIFEYGVDFNMLGGMKYDRMDDPNNKQLAKIRMGLVTDWAMRWHKLGTMNFGPQYNAELQKLTDVFAKGGANRAKPNGSALNQLRTNEIELSTQEAIAKFGPPNPADPVNFVNFFQFLKDHPWEMREFHVARGGQLEPAPVALTPQIALNDTQALANYIRRNEQDILAEQHQVPAGMLAGSALVPGAGDFPPAGISDPPLFWKASGVNPEARFKFSLNTCNGCHLREGGLQTLPPGEAFLQVRPRKANEPATLSPFMTGHDVPDPVTGAVRHLDDIGRRVNDLNQLIGYSHNRNLVPTRQMEMPFPSRVH
ncbi:MAG TPA: hypothetical protein V6D00_02605 [Pantanalinema sp.]